ncbi:hypothetical protein IEQ44_08595 [Nocardioides sp. Y6]|uniref:SPW repeat-containing protein n=1 Tax=Nocardioides malaquae TaxID=2773426 RepID=A0ABR9RTK5_9ACTN|nr:hypothetical protein [Nocardioides malaquae]MBE7324710.1 hypothetical protein [Nocardioides malaquae]
MTVRQIGGLLGACGGVVWIARWAVAPGEGAAEALRWVGLVLVLLGLACVGLTLVKGTALWLDAVVAVAAPALFWAVYEVVRGEVRGAFILHALLGVVCLLVGAVTLVRDRYGAADETEGVAARR